MSERYVFFPLGSGAAGRDQCGYLLFIHIEYYSIAIIALWLPFQ